ncbi:MAG TPA: class I tRNA ligase family protein, partial [Dehalococcoidales bacterium]|nr:class I tRNA ligase family protein [Dehalococcoidales bacterium]
GNDLKLTRSRLEAGRNFANKLWNATRFIVRNLPPPEQFESLAAAPGGERPREDRWILSRLSRTVTSVTALMADFQFGEALRQIYEFLWGEFCDWYIEFAKIRLHSAGEVSPLPVLVHVLETSLRLLHPYMPFVTEELWQNLKKRLPSSWQASESIMISAYPVADETAVDPEAEGIMGGIIDIIHSIRNARAQYRIASSRWLEAQIYAGELTPAMAAYQETIQTLARVKPATFFDKRLEGQPGEDALALILKQADVVIPMAGIVDLAAEKKRLQKEIEQVQAEVARLQALLGDKIFLAKAPAAVVEKERQKLNTLIDKLARLKQQLAK